MQEIVEASQESSEGGPNRGKWHAKGAISLG